MAPKNLAEVPAEEVAAFVKSFDNILFDCDGVLLLGEDIIPGVKDSVNSMKEMGKEIKLITNNSFRTTREWNEIFEDVELEFTSHDVIFPTKAVIHYLQAKKFNKKAFVLGQPAMVEELKEYGIGVYDYKDCPKLKHVSDLEDYIGDDLSIGAVIVDLDFNLTYPKLMKAATILKRPDVHFIFCATDKTAPFGENYKIIGSYFIGETLEMITGRKPVILGKPSVTYNNFVKKNYKKIDPARTLFVGDSLMTDMLFATKCNYQKLLVLTGTTSYETMMSCSKEVSPKYYLRSLGDLHKLLN
ncbi:PREDICTED: 4-nitrophenylphosphatase-like [Nicrophorus vespilloides]|uniref:4-nitrophenylphosphatase-like n=1 Tax=Nicrophorus vespilloides TaxID=110193 RepID=A0ABM1MVH4_NICVS|nr:PREDICTED: 4-nitrophenylphosphatase-like [Nicrophorus vespilloides]